MIRLAAECGGSSPQMRGAPRPDNQPKPAERIIPADAGSTIRRPAARLAAKDHPRRCGEHRCPIVPGLRA